MRNLGIAITTIVASVLLAGTAVADVINVPGDYPTIQGAVDAASDGDEIIVAPGTYTSTQDGHVVDMKGKAVTLRASGTPEETIIDGENARRGIACASGETDATVIEGFTITNGYGTWYDYDGDGSEDWWEDAAGGIFCYDSSPTITDCTISGNTANTSSGGGISCCYNSSPTITGCTISGNTTPYNGGGIFCYSNSNPTITGCTIEGNEAYFGGGIYCDSSSPTITDCTITSNTANGDFGGGIHFYDASNPTITDCTISDNEANAGGGICCLANSSPTITGCTISGNELRETDWGGGIYNSSNSNSILSDTIVCGNDPVQIYGDWTNNGGNTVEDICPVFPGACCLNQACTIETAADCASNGGEYLGDGSTCDGDPCDVPPGPGACCTNGICRDAMEADCLYWGGSWLGEGTTCDDSPCPSDCLGDANGDGEVNVNDILLVISQYGVTCP